MIAGHYVMKDDTIAEDTNGRGDNKNDGANSGRKRGRQRQRSRSPSGNKGRGVGGVGGENRASRRVYVANVPFDVKWSDLKDLFREKIGNVVYAQLFEDEQGRSRGCGLVEFNDAASAQKAIEVLHRHEFKNRELVVKEDLDCERDRYGRLLLPGRREKDDVQRPVANDIQQNQNQNQMSQQQNQMSQMSQQPLQHNTNVGSYEPAGYVDPCTGTWNTYGLSHQFLESLGMSGQLNNRIFVANLVSKSIVF